MVVFDMTCFDALLQEADSYSAEVDSAKRKERESLFYRVCQAESLEEAGEELTTDDFLDLLSMARGIVEGYDTDSVMRSDVMHEVWRKERTVIHNRVL